MLACKPTSLITPGVNAMCTGDGGAALEKLRAAAKKAAAAPKPPKDAGKGLDSAGAASATMDAIAAMGSPGAVLSLLKKAKKPKPKKELSFKEKLAMTLGGR